MDKKDKEDQQMANYLEDFGLMEKWKDLENTKVKKNIIQEILKIIKNMEKVKKNHINMDTHMRGIFQKDYLMEKENNYIKMEIFILEIS